MSEKLKTMAVIAEDSDQRRHFMNLTERMTDAVTGLQALELLFAGHLDCAFSNLTYLTAPLVKNLEEINVEMMDFYKSGVVFAYPVKQDQAEVNHED